jgi:hypothetical protein
LSAPRRNASGTPVLFLPQAVALAACCPVRRLLFLPLLGKRHAKRLYPMKS